MSAARSAADRYPARGIAFAPLFASTGCSVQEVEEPQDDEWRHAFGVVPERDDPSGEAWVRAVELVPEAGEQLRVSWDLYGDSIRFCWVQGNLARLELYREGVVGLSIPVEARPATSLRVAYQQGGLTGVIYAEVWPHFTYTDTLLHTE